jgi:SAM-dependent methyltransferase
MSEWWQSFFDEYFLQYAFPRIRRRSTLRDVRFIEKALAPRKRARILDVCCGIGRHSVELASKGYRMTGVDVSDLYLKMAAARAKRRKVKVAFEKCDMRRLPYRGEFDAALLMWTSFGYFEDEKDDLKGLRSIARALRPNGKFIVDVINRDWLIKNFQPHSWLELKDGFMLERREFDSATSRMKSEWLFVHKGENKVERKQITLRVYSLHELMDVIDRAGMEPVAVFGDRENVMPAPDHRMLEVMAQKR